MDFKVGETDVSLWIMLVIAGGVLVLLSPFFDMIVMQSAEEAMNLGYTGIELLTLEDSSLISKIPVITMVVGINNIIAILLPLVLRTNRMNMNIEITASSLIGIVMFSLFIISGPTNNLYTGDMSVLVDTFMGMGTLTMNLGIGVYICVAGLALSLFGAILRYNDL